MLSEHWIENATTNIVNIKTRSKKCKESQERKKINGN